MIRKRLRKIIQQVLCIFYLLKKKKKYVQLIYQKLIEIVEKKQNYSLNGSKQKRFRVPLDNKKNLINI